METFSRDELIAALRLVLEEEDAVEIANGAFELGEDARIRAAAAGRSEEEQAFVHLAAMNLSQGTLCLLALDSNRGARMVNAFRDWQQRVGRASAERRAQADASWNAKYAQSARAVSTGGE